MKTTKKCYKCGQNKSVKVFEMKDRFYGSKFDNLNFKLNLCDNCVESTNIDSDWFDNELNKVEDLFIFDYTNEEKIINIINTLPINIQEEILNQPTPCNPFKMDSEEWMKIYSNGFFNF